MDAISAVEPPRIGRTDIEAESDTRGDDVRAARLDLDLADRRHRAVDREGGVPNALDLRRGRHECVLAPGHRRRSGMPRPPLEHELPTCVPDDSGHDSDGRVPLGQHGALLDVELEKHPRQRVACSDERAASDAPDLLTAKHDNRADSDALDGLDRRDDAERPVEAATLRHGVEM